MEMRIALRILELQRYDSRLLYGISQLPIKNLNINAQNTVFSVQIFEHNATLIVRSIKENIGIVPDENWDIFASFVSEYDSSIVGIPKWAVSLAACENIKLLISYTII